MNVITLIYSTYPSAEKAQSAFTRLLEERLVGCGVVLPVISSYWWHGAIASDNEWVLIAKTLPYKVLLVEKRIIEIHEYQVPCIICIEAQASDAYVAWLAENVQ